MSIHLQIFTRIQIIDNVDYRILFQHDGAPLHFIVSLREFLYGTFPDQWIPSEILV